MTVQSELSQPAQIDTDSPPAREFAANFSESELKNLDELVHQLTTPEIEGKAIPKWNELSPEQKQLLIKRYGHPRHISRQVRVIDYTRGEACADNERGLPSDFESHDFGVWDKNILVFALYGSAPRLQESTKIRAVPAGLVVGINGTVLLPDYFYTPFGSVRRALLISQMNRNPRGDKSLRLADDYLGGAIDTDGLMLTVYRKIGSRMGIGDHVRDSQLGKKAMEKLGIAYLDHKNPVNKYRQMVEIGQEVQQKIAEIVSTSNLLLIKKAFGESEKIVHRDVKSGIHFVHFMDIESGQEEFIRPMNLQKQLGRFSAVKDPTWQYGDQTRPWVFRYRSEKDGQTVEKYGYVSNQEVFE